MRVWLFVISMLVEINTAVPMYGILDSIEDRIGT